MEWLLSHRFLFILTWIRWMKLSSPNLSGSSFHQHSFNKLEYLPWLFALHCLSDQYWFAPNYLQHSISTIMQNKNMRWFHVVLNHVKTHPYPPRVRNSNPSSLMLGLRACNSSREKVRCQCCHLQCKNCDTSPHDQALIFTFVVDNMNSEIQTWFLVAD